MFVKIGNSIFDSSIEPIMIILSEEEKQLISNMGDKKKFCSFPSRMSIEEAEKFMIDEIDTK